MFFFLHYTYIHSKNTLLHLKQKLNREPYTKKKHSHKNYTINHPLKLIRNENNLKTK